MKNMTKDQRRAVKIVNGPKKAKRFGDARDNPDFSGQRSTMPARQRPGKTYVGGRPLRRAHARLASAQKGILECRAAAGKGGKQGKSDSALKMPGAMHP